MADSFFNKFSDDDTSQTKKKIKLIDNLDQTFSISTSSSDETKKPLNFDAWGRPKATSDYSIFHGMFTHNIPPEVWVKNKNFIEDMTQDDTDDIYSKDGKLTVKSTSGSTYLHSRRSPRCQPNRGTLYSTSIFLPNPTAQGARRFGIFYIFNGAFFELTDGILYAVIRRTIDGVTTDNKHPLSLNFDIDLSKGNIYDIQMQWRGVGNIMFYIGNPSTGLSKLVHKFEFLGTQTELTIVNPAVPLGFETIYANEPIQIECGCVDITSEGGKDDNRFYNTVDSGEVNLATAETAVLAIRVPKFFSNGLINTRDCILQRVTAYADANSFVRVYFTRDPSAITATWTAQSQFLEYAVDGAVTAFNISKMKRITTRRVPLNQNIDIVNPDPTNSEFYFVAGEYILVTLQAKANTFGGATIDFSQII